MASKSKKPEKYIVTGIDRQSNKQAKMPFGTIAKARIYAKKQIDRGHYGVLIHRLTGKTQTNHYGITTPVYKVFERCKIDPTTGRITIQKV